MQLMIDNSMAAAAVTVAGPGRGGQQPRNPSQIPRAGRLQGRALSSVFTETRTLAVRLRAAASGRAGPRILEDGSVIIVLFLLPATAGGGGGSAPQAQRSPSRRSLMMAARRTCSRRRVGDSVQRRLDAAFRVHHDGTGSGL
jgi:hypothetical protein